MNLRRKTNVDLLLGTALSIISVKNVMRILSLSGQALMFQTLTVAVTRTHNFGHSPHNTEYILQRKTEIETTCLGFSDV